MPPQEGAGRATPAAFLLLLCLWTLISNTQQSQAVGTQPSPAARVSAQRKVSWFALIFHLHSLLLTFRDYCCIRAKHLVWHSRGGELVSSSRALPSWPGSSKSDYAMKGAINSSKEKDSEHIRAGEGWKRNQGMNLQAQQLRGPWLPDPDSSINGDKWVPYLTRYLFAIAVSLCVQGGGSAKQQAG